MNKKTLPRHIIGGVAFTSGLVLYAPDVAVMALREPSGQIAVKSVALDPVHYQNKLIKLFFVRGLWLLWNSISLNGRLRRMVDQTASAMIEPGDKSTGAKHKPSASLFPTVGLVAAVLIYGAVLFAIDLWNAVSAGQNDAVQTNGVALGLSLLAVAYILWKGDLWSYLGYHGAEHQAITAYENGKIDIKNIGLAWPYQNRCGAGVVSYVAIFLVALGLFAPELTFWQTVALALVLFSLSYELVHFLDKYSAHLWARLLLIPGVLLQLLVAKHPHADQSEVAYAAISELVKESAVLKSQNPKFDEMTLD
ncbi:MAG: DUF1385 domain-containing protein [Patescibacteria group bacterium]|jgi:uncharacterized protein YqhQ